jgi:capsular polysaccharide biosynthesis protein
MNKNFIVSVKIKVQKEHEHINKIKYLFLTMERSDRRLIIMNRYIKENYPSSITYTELVFNTKKQDIAERIRENLQLSLRASGLSGKITVSSQTDTGWKFVNVKKQNNESDSLFAKNRNMMLTNSQPTSEDMVN